MLFRMVPKLLRGDEFNSMSFRAVLFRMVPKQNLINPFFKRSFRAVLFRMVPTHIKSYSFLK